MKRTTAPNTLPSKRTDITDVKSISKEDLKKTTKEDVEKATKHQKVKKTKVALIVSYVGRGYQGSMYLKNGEKTIEGDVENAIYLAGCISEDNKHDFKKVSWSRCARTDKGVSAANNIFSLKMGTDGNFIERINSHLPETIRVMDCVRVRRLFDAHTRVDNRNYEYVFPSYALQQLHPNDLNIDLNYKATEEDIQYFNFVIGHYIRSHNFQNYTYNTKETTPESQSNIRNILSIEATLVQRNGLDLVVVALKGQSFMIYQIRKMVGFALMLTNMRYSKEMVDSIMETSFTLVKWRSLVPTAPPYGLFLERCNFDVYNNDIQNNIQTQNLPIINSEETIKKCEEFKEKSIWTDITNYEKENHPFAQYFQNEVHYSKIDAVLSGKATLETFNEAQSVKTLPKADDKSDD
ncbi:tRNA pseudouridine synthase A, putative [Entamoeba invadens IP1]|uniref:tRNA pseudouridine synthase A, putative n=1 Tax=Entamoeba invadens IP1 TaxID=370355 RepID=UPI0002C3F5E2|nr:tRNA pseudouridine synthase A, putative [Entamoeba invadens IP1]ELP94232.1 tRNA pseudouridine synthase A, putative [Entamoeba invadens IP1]|eukprot:XP_004261003.1 tRNA pseudouridine synthase A, putative [Entamoeba invadens IP1]